MADAESNYIAPQQNSLKSPGKIMRKYHSSREWLQSCKQIQQAKMTPELKARLQKQAKRQRKIGKKCKRAKVYQKANEMSRKAWAQGNLRLQSAPPPRAHYSEQLYHSKANMQLKSIQEVYHNAAAWENDNDEEEDALENQLALIESEQTNDVAENALLDIDANDDKSIHAILQQLAVEPKSDKECGIKFKLYSDLLETVEASRKATNDFWKDCKEDFAKHQGNVVAQVEKDIKDIDSEDNLGIAFDGRRWYVYDMTLKADQNNSMIKGVLKKIETKLELLNNNDDDCPFCLDPLAEIGEHVVLGCCHKACKQCWENWQEIKGRNAFCPLCRQDDFLQDIVNMG